jgi:hypothetical protein
MIRLRLFQMVLVSFLALVATAGTALANTAGLQAQGQGSLRWFGLKIYDAQLKVSPGFTAAALFDKPFALELVYARKLYGKAIAERSLEEMKKVGVGTEQQQQQWLSIMLDTFPDVGADDRLTGVHNPGVGALFYMNGKLIKTINDVEFSKAFFSIWLDPKTSEPDLRRALLGSALRADR